MRIECDNCEQTFEVTPGEADKVACPHCGDVNRVPAGGPEAHGLPSDSGPEQQIMEVHPALFRAHPFQGLLLVSVLGAGAVLTLTAVPFGALAAVWAVPGLALVAAALAWWAWWLLRSHYWVKLSISNKRTVRQEGIIRRHTSEVLHDHVRNVEIRQTFLQRVTNVGSIGISSSGQDGIEIEVEDVPKPYELKALIDRYRNM